MFILLVQSAVGERLVADAALSCCPLPAGREEAADAEQEDHIVALEWTEECAHKLEAAEDVGAHNLTIAS